MTFPRVPALIVITALSIGWAAQAAEPAPVATADPAGSGAPPATPQMSTADQIDAYLKSSPAAKLPRDALGAVTSTDPSGGGEPRRVHGVVDVTVGSNGYRSAYVASELPVGKTGTAVIAVGESRFDGRGGRYGGPYGGPQTHQSLALGLTLGGAEPTRCRTSPDDAATPRDPRFDGGQRPCHATDALPAP